VINNIKVREWGLKKIGSDLDGHAINEVYNKNLSKWVCIDVSECIYFLNETDKTFTPLSTLEVFSNSSSQVISHSFNPAYHEDSKKIQKFYLSNLYFPFVIDKYVNNRYDTYLKKYKSLPIPIIHGILILLKKSYNYKYITRKTIFICFSTSEGSLSEHFVGLSNELSKFYNVNIFSDNKYRPKKLIDKVKLFYWPSKRPTQLIDFLFYLKHLIKKKPVITISIFGSVNISIISSFLTGVKYKVSWIRTLSSQFKQKKILVLRKRLVFNFTDIVITNSKSTALDAKDFYQINQHKISILPNSVVDYYSKYKSIKTEKDKILYVGRLHKSKGVDVLIKAFEIIAKSNHQLLLYIVGSGPETESLKQLARDTGFYERIKFIGKISKEEVLKEMKSSYITVIPSNSEAFGYTVIEAMSMKTAVIGADNTGIKEIIINDKSGLLFRTGDHKDLATKIEILYNYPDKRNDIASNGYQHFKENYSSEIAIKRDANFFINLIENNNHKR
jgi:glycosyltransferase involved in cell wall biosynthesis